jgi:hypothetical protein
MPPSCHSLCWRKRLGRVSYVTVELDILGVTLVLLAVITISAICVMDKKKEPQHEPLAILEETNFALVTTQRNIRSGAGGVG